MIKFATAVNWFKANCVPNLRKLRYRGPHNQRVVRFAKGTWHFIRDFAACIGYLVYGLVLLILLAFIWPVDFACQIGPRVKKYRIDHNRLLRVSQRYEGFLPNPAVKVPLTAFRFLDLPFEVQVTIIEFAIGGPWIARGLYCHPFGLQFEDSNQRHVRRGFVIWRWSHSTAMSLLLANRSISAKTLKALENTYTGSLFINSTWSGSGPWHELKANSRPARKHRWIFQRTKTLVTRSYNPWTDVMKIMPNLRCVMIDTCSLIRLGQPGSEGLKSKILSRLGQQDFLTDSSNADILQDVQTHGKWHKAWHAFLLNTKIHLVVTVHVTAPDAVVGRVTAEIEVLPRKPTILRKYYQPETTKKICRWSYDQRTSGRLKSKTPICPQHGSNSRFLMLIPEIRGHLDPVLGHT